MLPTGGLTCPGHWLVEIQRSHEKQESGDVRKQGHYGRESVVDYMGVAWLGASRVPDRPYRVQTVCQASAGEHRARR